MTQQNQRQDLCDRREELFRALLVRMGHVLDSLKQSIGDEDFQKFHRGYLDDVMRLQNRTRGRLGELLGDISLNAPQKVLVRDKAIFATPLGGRRVDIYWPALGLALEAKMGRVTLTSRIRKQIGKDAWLLDQGVFQRVVWLLVQGGSQKVLTTLKDSSIEVEEGWPVNNSQSTTIMETPRIRVP